MRNTSTNAVLTHQFDSIAELDDFMFNQWLAEMKFFDDFSKETLDLSLTKTPNYEQRFELLGRKFRIIGFNAYSPVAGKIVKSDKLQKLVQKNQKIPLIQIIEEASGKSLMFGAPLKTLPEEAFLNWEGKKLKGMPVEHLAAALLTQYGGWFLNVALKKMLGHCPVFLALID